MKNMPSVMKEMPIAAACPATGKRAPHERLLQVVDGGRDFSASAASPDSPEAFQRLLQKNLRGQDRGSVHGASPGVDRQIEGHDSGRAQMTRAGIKAELQAPVEEESLSDREELMATPEIRGTAKQKISKGQPPVGAAHFIISSGNIASVNEYRDPSLETTVGSEGRPDSHRDALGAATAGAATMAAGSDAAKILPRGGRRGAFGKAEEPIQFSNGHVDGRVVFVERGTGIGRSVVTEGTGGNDNAAPPDDLGNSTRATHSGNSPQDNGGRGDDAGAVHTPLKQSPGERVQGVATRSKVLAQSSARGAQGADIPPVAVGSDAEEETLSLGVRQGASGKTEGPVLFSNRLVGGQTVFTETGSVFGRDAATIERGGSGTTDPTGVPGGATYVVARGTEFGQDDGSKGADVAVSASPFKTSSGGGRVHQPTAGEKVSPLPSAFSAQAADAVSSEAGSDASGMLIPRGGHQHTSGETEWSVQLRHRQVRKEGASAERGAGPGGRAVAVETDGSGNAGSAGTFGNSTRAGGESRQDSGSRGAASVITPASLMTGPGERVHQPLAGEKVMPLPSPFAAAVVDAVPIGVGFATSEGVSSAGRQTVLLTQVIEVAQPLMQQGGGRVLISLNPPSLGELDIDVRVKRDSVELFVIANNQDVQQTLCAHVEQLRKALVDQGLNMDRFQVVVGDRSDGQQGRDPRQEGMSGWQGGSRNDHGGYRPEGDEENASDGMRKAVRSDVYPSIGGVNVFI